MHDIALRGKDHSSGNMHDLMDFRVESGDQVLQKHMSTAPQKAKYTSIRSQNELISACCTVLRKELVKSANASEGFSLLADETTDISGTEQLSLGIRFADNTRVREEFLGFVPLIDRSAVGIAGAIIQHCNEFGLNFEKLVGQGYDGCSAMAGNEGGVQTLIRQKYPKALFVHCSAHRLNLVINDLNKLSEVRNVISTIKCIINFFRESAQRRQLVANIPLLCETRWSHKYKSIRLFASNFPHIVTQLEFLSKSGVKKTREQAYQLLCACQASSFIVILVIIKKYSAMFEPVAQALQAVQLDLLEVQKHIQELLTILRDSRTRCEEEFSRLFTDIELLAESVGTAIVAPRQVAKQLNRANPPNSTTEEFYRRSVYVPYLDSIISSLDVRFSEHNKPAYSLLNIHPLQMMKVTKEQFMIQARNISEFCEIDNFCEQTSTWYDLWQNRQRLKSDSVCETFEEMDLIGLLDHATLFPAIQQAIRIALALPATTCTIERSFSTLRRVKTWLRSTMTTDRLSGLCMMSVHREMIMKNKTQFIDKVVNTFAENSRRLQLLFND
jgi:hypothetical protein